MRSYELITKTAAAPAPSWTNREKAMFHCFNPNGVLASKRITDDLIAAAVESGKAKSGAILAYGSLSCFNVDRLYELISKKYVGRIELKVVLDMLKRDVDFANDFLASL